MKKAAYEFAGVDPRKLFLRIQALIACSCLVDVLVLAAFATTGLIGTLTPLIYGAVGLSACALFSTLIKSGFSARFQDSNLTMAQVVAWVAIELTAVARVPSAAVYFLGVIVIVFSFASLRLRVRDAIVACTLAGAGLILSLYSMTEVGSLPHLTGGQRLALAGGLVSALVRFTLVQIYGNRMRVFIRERHARDKVALRIMEIRSAAVANALHEDLGQQLAGVALMLTATATRLQREEHAVTQELHLAAGHLNKAIEQVRTLAAGARLRRIA